MTPDRPSGLISFVILTWNSEAYIRDCVDAVFQTLAPTRLGAEVFIVDNGSGDRSPELIAALAARWPRQVFPLYLDQNFGTTLPRNLALSRCRGEYICIMDSDVALKPGTLEELVRTLDGHPERGLAAPKLVYPGGSLQKSTDGFPSLGRKLIRFFCLRTMEAREARQAGSREVRPVDYAISALWVFRRSLLRQVGVLDEKIFYAPEDADFCLRIWQAGLQVVYAPEAEAVHHTQEAGRGLRINRTVLHHLSGLAYFFGKHGFLLKPPVFQTTGAGSSGKGRESSVGELRHG